MEKKGETDEYVTKKETTKGRPKNKCPSVRY